MLPEKLPEIPQDGEKFRILVVEDDMHIARLLTANVAKAGFLCRHAPDGLQGFKAFEDFNPHLVLLDVMMPGMDGRELCAKIREQSMVPVIMLTALRGDEDQVRGLKVGADDYVAKPFNPQLLLARVMSQLRRVYRYGGAAVEEAVATGARTGASVSNTSVSHVSPAPVSPAPVSQASVSKAPAGWAVCEGCGYMGPQQKFDSEGSSGQRLSRCPVCNQSDRVSFSIS